LPVTDAPPAGRKKAARSFGLPVPAPPCAYVPAGRVARPAEIATCEDRSPRVSCGGLQGVEFKPNEARFALRVPDVEEARKELEAQGVEFLGDTLRLQGASHGLLQRPVRERRHPAQTLCAHGAPSRELSCHSSGPAAVRVFPDAPAEAACERHGKKEVTRWRPRR